MDNWIFESKSSMDKMTRLKTLFVAVLFFGIIFLVLFHARVEDKLPFIIATFLLVFYIMALTYGILNTPISYKLSVNKLLIHKRIKPITILIENIILISLIDKSDKKGLIRTFGAEGVIGNIGRYASIKHKNLNVYTSRDTNWVLIQTNGRTKYIISPNDLNLIDRTQEIINANKLKLQNVI